MDPVPYHKHSFAALRRSMAALSILGGVGVVLAIFWGHLLFEIGQNRTSDLGAAKKDAANITLAAQELTSRLLLSAEHHLRWIRREYDRQGDSFDFVAYYHSGQGFKDISTYAAVYDVNGDVLNSSQGSSDPKNNIGDRNYFKSLREMEGDRFIIAKPVMGKTSGKWIIPVVVRRNTLGGEFNGAVVAGVSVDYILDFYRSFNLGRYGSVSLFDLDGTIMARRASGKSLIGENFSSNQAFVLSAEKVNSVYEEVSAIDGISSITGYRLFSQMPLLITASLSIDDVLTDFAISRRDMLWQGAGVTLSILLFAGMALFFLRKQNVNLIAVEKADQASREAYHRLVAIIDGTSEQIAALDQQFRFMVFNKRYADEFERIFARRISVGQSLIDVLSHSPDEQKAVLEIWGRALEGEVFTIIRQLGAPHLDRKTLEMTYSPLRDVGGKVVGAVHVVHDVTEHATVECELRRSNAELDRFSAVISQDIVSSLRKLASSVDQIKQRQNDLSSADIFVSSAFNETHRVLKFAEGLSDYVHLQKKTHP
jgi:PAS domain S-box-containing protein